MDTEQDSGLAGATTLRLHLRPVLALAVILLGLLLVGTAGAIEDEPEPVEPHSELPTTGGGSFPFEGPAVLEPGSISFRYSTPGQPDLLFVANGVEAEGFPGSLYLHETPFGPAGLLAGDGATIPHYHLLFLDLGVTFPVSADASGVQFVGTVGASTMTVNATPITGPNGTLWWIQRDKNGRRCIYFFNPCVGATFKQFFTKKITWKGTKNDPAGGPNPVPEGGTWSGPDIGTGNGGDSITTDGTHVYVDSNAGSNGDYPNVLTTGYGSLMTDSPDMGDVSGVATQLENSTANGRVVEEITATWHFTLYVYCGGQIIEKIQWSYSQTAKKPFAPGTPSGDFGGPTPGPANPPFVDPGPVSTPATQLEPHHAEALNGSDGFGFAQGNHSGANAPGGW